MTERQGVEIDYCPKCRGVWLDRGELDRIIERALPERHPGDSGDRKNEGYGPMRKSNNMGILIRRGGFLVICLTKNETRAAKGDATM
jgi:Zn-finger nucleic acid-binding protein